MLDRAAEHESFIIEIDGRVHPSSVVNRTCYALAEIGTFSIEAANDRFLVSVHPVAGISRSALEDRFLRELIDFSVRADIEEKTSVLRDLIWRTAFAEAAPRHDD